MRKKELLIFITSLALGIFSGCSENNKQETKESQSVQKVISDTQKIEVVQNKNAAEIKVALKESDANQSKSYYYDYNVKSAYNPNAQPANSDASVREKPRDAVDANLHVRSPYENVEVSMLVKKLSKEFIVKCSACHNDYANGVIGPSLLGKDADFIFKKILQFKDGSATNVLMKDLVSQMDKEEIKALADEIYEFNKKIKEMRR